MNMPRNGNDLSRRVRRIATLFCLLSVLTLSPSPTSPAAIAQEATDDVSIPGPLVELVVDDRYLPVRVPPPDLLQAQGIDGVQRVRFTVNYNPTTCSGPTTAWPNNAHTAFDYAASIWSVLTFPLSLEGNPTIEVDACWRTGMASGVLGSAQAKDLYHDFPGAPMANTWYVVALANQRSNSDLNGGDAEILAEFNSTFTWYFGLDGETPAGQVDFVTTVLHEIGHGLGFTGSMDVDDGVGQNECNGTSSVGCRSDPPYIYDRFAENDAGTNLVNSIANNSARLGAQLTSNNLFFNGFNASHANDNNHPRLYAPATWEPGSSFSHLDDNTFDATRNALMTHALAYGESAHHPGEVTIGLLGDIGWPLPLLLHQIWVDGSVAGPGSGGLEDPFRTVIDGVNAVSNTGTVRIRPGNYPEVMTIRRPMTIRSTSGLVTIGW